jgi:hypothetical protein
VTQTDRKLLKIRELGVAPARISSFGLDARGEIHLVGFDGVIYRLELGGTAFE